jgi:hypothetical protein
MLGQMQLRLARKRIHTTHLIALAQVLLMHFQIDQSCQGEAKQSYLYIFRFFLGELPLMVMKEN